METLCSRSQEKGKGNGPGLEANSDVTNPTTDSRKLEACVYQTCLSIIVRLC